MSRTLVIRRLTAVLVLLTILGFALPATAAPGSHHSSRATTVQAPTSLFDQILSWLGSFLSGPSHAGTAGRTKAAISTPVPTASGLSSASTDLSIGVDPNGHS